MNTVDKIINWELYCIPLKHGEWFKKSYERQNKSQITFYLHGHSILRVWLTEYIIIQDTSEEFDFVSIHYVYYDRSKYKICNKIFLMNGHKPETCSPLGRDAAPYLMEGECFAVGTQKQLLCLLFRDRRTYGMNE
jgi:hypothetical protein